VVPSLFSLLGLGGASFITVLAQYRFLFLLLTFILLGISFCLNYIKTRAHLASRIIFWISAAVALGFIGYTFLLI
jgi:hypothetical protein